MPTLPQTLREFWDKRETLDVVAEQSVPTWPCGGVKIVVRLGAALWLAYYTMGEDSTDADQRLDWREAVEKPTVEYVEKGDPVVFFGGIPLKRQGEEVRGE